MSENVFGHASGELFQGRYQILRQLSKAHSTGRRTLLALDLPIQKRVVIKVLTFNNNNFRWEDLKLFEREAATLRALSHPAIPCYLDYFELDLPSEKGFVLVQTYIEAKSLQEYLEAGRTFSLKEAKQIAKSLLEVLTYLHHRQPSVIHRDIKPSNILLGNRSGNSPGQVYLVDFGSVQTAIREGSTRTVTGTYGYMPPEQFGGRATPASDLYSLGATLIYLLTGKHPADLLEDDLQIQFEQFSHISPDFAAWLKWMTQPSLNCRLASAQEALKALEAPPTNNFILSKKLSHTNNQSSVVKKADNSRISLRKSLDSMEIIFLPAVLQNLWQFLVKAPYSLAIVSLMGLIIFSFLNGFSIKAATINLLNIFLCLILSLILGFVILAIVGNLWNDLLKIFKQTRLRIDQHNITLTSKLFGVKVIESLKRPRQEICKLVCTAKSYKLINLEKQEERVELPAGLTIWAGNTQFDIPPVTQLERDWLAQELSDWLNLPITEE